MSVNKLDSDQKKARVTVTFQCVELRDIGGEFSSSIGSYCYFVSGLDFDL